MDTSRVDDEAGDDVVEGHADGISGEEQLGNIDSANGTRYDISCRFWCGQDRK